MPANFKRKLIIATTILLTVAVSYGLVLPGISNAQETATEQPEASNTQSSLKNILAQLLGNSIAPGLGTILTGNFVSEGIIAATREIMIRMLATSGNVAITLAAVLVWAGALVLNAGMYITLNMKQIMDNIQIVTSGWIIFRDLANMIFIFIMLYIAVNVILGNIGSVSKILGQLILIAVLINFSMFITGVIIDASNVLSLQFYNAMFSGFDLKQPSTWERGPATAFMQGLKLQSAYDPNGTDAYFAQNQATAEQAAGNALARLKPFIDIFIATTLGTIVMLVAAFVFFVAGVLLIIRLVILMFLLMVAPVAFAATILPGTSGIWHKWKQELVKQVLWVPAYLALTYVIVKGIAENNTEIISGPGSLHTLAYSNVAGIGFVVNYIFMIGLLVGTLLVAKSFGIWGASSVIGWGNTWRKGLQGFIGRRTLGWGARKLADSNAMKSLISSRPGFGAKLYGGLAKVSGTSWGGTKGGYDATKKKQEKTRIAAGVASVIGPPSAPLKNPVSTFSVARNEIMKGETTTLRWKTENAKKVTVTPDVGGTVAPNTESSRIIAPKQTTTYSITAEDDTGRRYTQQVQVRVTDSAISQAQKPPEAVKQAGEAGGFNAQGAVVKPPVPEAAPETTPPAPTASTVVPPTPVENPANIPPVLPQTWWKKRISKKAIETTLDKELTREATGVWYNDERFRKWAKKTMGTRGGKKIVEEAVKELNKKHHVAQKTRKSGGEVDEGTLREISEADKDNLKDMIKEMKEEGEI